jgi:DNA polymerase-3 subunit epsilon
MRVIVFDTETTGLRPGSICQLAYIVAEISSGGVSSNGGGGSIGSGGSIGAGVSIVEAKNIYFAVPFVPNDAAKIHGLTADILERLSGGQTFSDRADEIEAAFSACGLWVAHNVDFDRSFLLAEFRKAGRAPREGRNYCTMRELAPECKLPPTRLGMSYKYPTLEQAASHLKITGADIRACCESAFGDGQGASFHDARYDSATAYLCFLAAIELGIAP